MDTVDVIVIGAGVVGLAIAARLARTGRDLLLVDRHEGFGRETSSRNSEVIHAGLYYGHDLLKTRLCVRGNPLLYERCRRDGIPHRATGKIIVAADRDEEARVHAVFNQATTNGVPGVRLLGRDEMLNLEPAVSGVLGLFSPSTGIIDTHQLMARLEHDAVSLGATIAYRCEVTGIQWTGRVYAVDLREAGGETTALGAAAVVNAAGLSADRVAEMAGIDAERAGYRLRFCKGEYFRIADRHRGTLNHLVYPPPSPYHLGTHATLSLDGRLRLGPNSIYVDTADYRVDPDHRDAFFAEARGFLPFLSRDDLSADQSGIRPRLFGPNEPFRDFVIREESDRGLPGLVNLIGIESPGLTACLTIAELVEGLL